MEADLFIRLTKNITIGDLQESVGPELDLLQPLSEAKEYVTIKHGIDRPGVPCPVRYASEPSSAVKFVGFIYTDYLDCAEGQLPRDLPVGDPVGLQDMVSSAYGISALDTNYDCSVADAKPVDNAVFRDPVVGDFMFPIFPCNIASASTSILDFMLQNRGKKGWESQYFVFDGAELTGTITMGHIVDSDSLELALLALVLLLERKALELCCVEPLESWGALSPSRREQVLEWYNRNCEIEKDRPRSKGPATNQAYDSVDSPKKATDVLQRTMMIDKKTMIKKRQPLDEHSYWISRLIQRAQTVRNVCVHPTTTKRTAVEAADLVDFVIDCRRAVGLIDKALPESD